MELFRDWPIVGWRLSVCRRLIESQQVLIVTLELFEIVGRNHQPEPRECGGWYVCVILCASVNVNTTDERFITRLMTNGMGSVAFTLSVFLMLAATRMGKVQLISIRFGIFVWIIHERQTFDYNFIVATYIERERYSYQMLGNFQLSEYMENENVDKPT